MEVIMAKKLVELEEETFQEDDTNELPPPDVVAYNELRSCADLFRMKKDGILEIQPEFQREKDAWNAPARTRFIDSLIKELPIPSMCFSVDSKTRKWLVIDGLQRMATIIDFLSGEKWTLSKLEDIDPKISGQSVSEFADKNSKFHSYYTRIENLTLPITVLRCDYSNAIHVEYLFTIFHRLNTGGVKLNNQEIRNCIFSGRLNNLLKELDENSAWRKINRMKKDISHRFAKQELLLRFFAFHDKYKSYEGKLAKFLNRYMKDNRSPDEKFLNAKKELFNRTVDVIYKKIFEGKIPKKLSISVLEAVLVGVSSNLDFLESQPNGKVQTMHEKLLEHAAFSEKELIEGLARKDKVIERMSVSIKIFSGR